MYYQKKFFFIICLISILSLSFNMVYAQNINDNAQNLVNNSLVSLNIGNKVVNYNILPAAKGKITYSRLEELAKIHPEGNNFIIYASSELPSKPDNYQFETKLQKDESAENTVAAGFPDFRISTYLNYTDRGVLESDRFVWSCARGETYKFSSNQTYSLSATVTGGSNSSSLGITGSISKTYSREYTFTGPPDSSPNNCREYRVKFYQDKGTYLQRCLDFSSTPVKLVWEQTGTFTEPKSFESYSFDKIVR